MLILKLKKHKLKLFFNPISFVEVLQFPVIYILETVLRNIFKSACENEKLIMLLEAIWHY